MSRLHCRGYLAISTIAAASALLVAAPAGASAAEESGSSGDTVAEPSGNSSQPAATEWTPQAAEGGTSGGEADAPLVHGSSVGSGAVTGHGGAGTGGAGSDGGEPSYALDSGGPYEPESSTPSTVDEPASAPRAESGTRSVQQTTTPAKKSRPVDVAVGAATSLGRSVSFQGDSSADSAPPAAAAPLQDSGGRASTSSYALSLLVIVVLGLIGFAGVRLRRHRRRERLEAPWREQEAAWEGAVRRAELAQASPPISESGATSLI